MHLPNLSAHALPILWKFVEMTFTHLSHNRACTPWQQKSKKSSLTNGFVKNIFFVHFKLLFLILYPIF